MKELTVEITDKCSLKCLFCSTLARKCRNTHITPEKMADILDKYPDFRQVRLSGGEPFEHPRLEELLEMLKERERITTLLSCGVKNDRVIPEKFLEQIEPLIHDIVFSYHGFYDEHERIVTSNRPFHLTYPYWDMMMDSADNANWVGIPVSFQTVAIQQNYDKLGAMAKTMGDLKNGCRIDLSWHILRFVKQGRGALNANQALTVEQAAELPKKAREWQKQYDVEITCTHSYDNSRCDCGDEKAVVTITGEEIPCSALKYGSKEKGKFACRKRL
jgi:MoaA/NifB/PqqE/SkfB family radical SAM enzyme